MEKSDVSISWQSPEYVEKTKTTDWYFAVSIIALALIVTSLLFKNVILAVILLLGSIIILIYAKTKPRNIYFSIDNTGITIDSNHYSYQNLQSFWIKENSPEFHKLLVKNHSLTNSILSITLPIKYTDPVREFLSTKIEEEPIVESALDSFLDRLGF